MPVILNGGHSGHSIHAWIYSVPLVDACDTEWRNTAVNVIQHFLEVPLVDACDTEWRGELLTRPSGCAGRATR